MLLMAHQGVLV